MWRGAFIILPPMLSLLKIQNLALVEDLVWELGPGLVGVTGETGAGKSIIVGALKLVLGERADRGLIRTGSETCSVEAVFDLKNPTAVDTILTDSGLDALDGESLIIRRVIGASSNKQFVNGSPVTSATLKQLGEHLVDLHGPHDHQSLHSRERQLEMLDAYATAESKVATYQKAYHVWRSTVQDYHELATSERASAQEIDMLKFQIGDIDDAQLKPDEEAELETRHKIAANGTRIVELSNAISERLSDGPQGILAGLREVARMLHELEKYDPQLTQQFAGFNSAQIELQEMEEAVREYAEQVEFEPGELDSLEERISIIQNLKRKYGPDVPTIIAFRDEAAAKLARMENRGEELEKLEAKVKTARADVDKLGTQLTTARRKAAPSLAKDIMKHLTDLGFQRAMFEVSLTPREEPGREGLEEVEFQFAPNTGEPLKPLRLTASSGEMSRVLLAVKCALAKQDGVPLMVFDEIDANVGGNIAEAVGRKMASLADRHQIIAISHMPQLASLAASQFVVTKSQQGSRTFSTLTEVKDDARVDELARMLGGKADSARAHAKSLLAAVEKN